ncbi:unnamed protein product [Blepharisma stoltei]|uniref:Uncharacterized protein n=1 Tax=Blepharisma stoltei TaxID=1481888 RepID=A0AAU9JM77_9CILI|nr:unnamed protein product [Blepharisma stoltei]
MKDKLNCCTQLKGFLAKIFFCAKSDNSDTQAVREVQSMSILNGISFNLSSQPLSNENDNENKDKENALDLSQISIEDISEKIQETDRRHRHELFVKTSFELSDAELSADFFKEKGSMISFDASSIQSCTDKESFGTDFQISSRVRTPAIEAVAPELREVSPPSIPPEPLAQNYVRSDTPEIVKSLRKMPKLPPLTPEHFAKTKRKFKSAFKFKNEIQRRDGSQTNRVVISKRISDMLGGEYQPISDGMERKSDVPILC